MTYSSNRGSGWTTELAALEVRCWNTAIETDSAGRPHIVFYNMAGGITTHVWADSPAAIDDDITSVLTEVDL